ncbi:MAG: bifunctional nicotinamidase/pyrazinamidase [Bacillota bacterium]|nr:bifunctional nicotinamidase/pyrazinamidase [Bacillota bacterium]HOK69838.1 bifunctional nicotinamidase/pyrazinamidase [Bacillota bacterium]HOL52579.1 bifunctional nicotinamidase/pyrazinamidase [Bacillota bacterium]HOO30883.1 bifunctional nicotinamidase/pyrazinamidase [Bacillota bacterium]HPQ01719.1 bifunctional nicotinamidase/pyrazinamidase [Bacillota bacterium]
MEALLLVDLQNDFLPGGALGVLEGDQVIPVANRVQEYFDIVIATADWHPPGHGSFASSHPGCKAGDVIELSGMPQVLWPDHCVQHTEGAEFSPHLNTGKIDKVIYKGMDPEIDSYSGFFDNGRQKATGLETYLRDQKVDTVYVMGLATDYCVKYTALDAVSLGYRTWLIEDGCRGVGVAEGDVERALAEMKAAGVRVVKSGDLG